MRPALRSLTVAVALAASTLAASPAQAAPSKALPVPYLAAGDSYPAGWGVTPAQSYPALLGAANYADIALVNNAEAGADTFELVNGQLTAGNAVVTITVGANDLDWVNVIRGKPTALGQLPYRLAALAGPTPGIFAPDGDPVPPIAGVLQAVATVNPGAKILVGGYPHLFGELAPTGACDLGGQMATGVQTAQANQLVDQLNAIIAGSVAAVSATGVNAEFVDVVPTFDGHGLCDTQTPWLYDLDDPATVPAPFAAFHANARGQKAYAQVVAKEGFRSTALVTTRTK